MSTISATINKWAATILLSASALLLAGASHAAPIYYNLNQTLPSSSGGGGGSVTGYIETNGTIGQIALTDIIDWDLYLTADTYASELTPSNSTVNATTSPTGLTATATELSFEFPGHELYFAADASHSSLGELCYDGGSNCFGVSSISLYQVAGGGYAWLETSGVRVIATAESGATPEPSSLVLLGLGAGLLGLRRTGWRRRPAS